MPLSLILLASVISSIIVAVETFEVDFAVSIEDIEELPKIKVCKFVSLFREPIFMKFSTF